MKRTITKDLADIKKDNKGILKQLSTHKFYIRWDGSIPEIAQTTTTHPV